MSEGTRDIYDVLATVQREMNVPKSRTNKFGGYSYRSLEDINAAAKPVCREHDCGYYFADEIVPLATGHESLDARWYLKATVTFFASGCDERVKVTAYAREEDQKKGMDEAQITGLASSYARKYAACALFAIDSGEEVDAMDNSETPQKPARRPKAPKGTKGPDTPQNVPQRPSQASTEAMQVLMGKARTFATMRGRSTADVLKALDATKAMSDLGASAERGYSGEQVAVASKVLDQWIQSAAKDKEN